MAGSWEHWETEPEEVVEIGPDAVFAHVRVRGIGRGSGLTMKVRVAVAFVLSDGKLLRMHSYSTRAEALKAAGFSEQ